MTYIYITKACKFFEFGLKTFKIMRISYRSILCVVKMPFVALASTNFENINTKDANQVNKF